MSIPISAVMATLDAAFPPQWAEEWDRVGLLCGDAQRDVTGVTLALDPTKDAIATAAASGANLLVTHHPAFLETPSTIRPGWGSGGIVFDALDAGVALFNAHTNLDRAPAAGGLLASRMELRSEGLLETRLQPMALVTTFVPAEAADAVTRAMVDAGGGGIGTYRECLFRTDGTGSFVAAADSSPHAGAPGTRAEVAEERVEMVAPGALGAAVARAARDAHPYEEPLVVVEPVEIARSAARMGSLASVTAPTTLRGLADHAARAFGVVPRVWGDPDAAVELVATATGSAGSLVSDVMSAGADVLLCGEVRYHDALEASSAGLGLIELGHDVSEWPLVDLLSEAVRLTPGLDQSLVRELPATPGWWTPGKDR